MSSAFEDDRRERPMCRSEASANWAPAMIVTWFDIVTPGTAHRLFPTVFHGVNQIKNHIAA